MINFTKLIAIGAVEHIPDTTVGLVGAKRFLFIFFFMLQYKNNET